MTFLFYHRLSSYLLIGSGFLALLVTGYYNLLSAVVFATIIAVGWRIDTGKLRLPISPLMWNLATVVGLGLCIIDVLYIRRMTSIGLVNFLIFLQTTKIFSPKHDQDYATIYVISFFELLISSIMTLSVLFALSCILFAITGTWALITLHLKREIEHHIIRKNPGRNKESRHDESYFDIPALGSLLNVRFFGGTFGITVLTFILSLIVFAILPRVREGFFFSHGNALSQPVSGFSEEVALDTFGTIRLDHSPVMRVILPAIPNGSQPPPRSFYWKGLSYNHYDGVRWRADTHTKRHIPIPSRYEEMFWLSKPDSTQTLLKQRIELISSQYEVLFAANQLHGVQGQFLSLQYVPLTGNTKVILNPYAPNYTIYSEIALPSEEALQNDHTLYPEPIRNMYLQLPELSERIRDLALTFGNNSSTVYATTLAIQNYLFQNYEYSLDVRRTSELMPLEDFLFINKAGHCEYYATSMAILLRILGIPARVVNGFAQGRWNEFGKFFTVRQSDAHAWVEVYFPSYGWITFDPTPPAAFGDTYQQFVEQRSLLANIYRYSEYLRTKWNRYIVDYSTNDQVRLVVGAFRASHSARRSISSSIRRIGISFQKALRQLSFRQLGIIFGTLGALIFVTRYLVRTFRSLRLKLPAFTKRSRSTRQQVIRFYKTMLHILAGKGITKYEATTPGEFVRYVTQTYPSYGNDVQHITHLYYAVRYGQVRLHDNELLAIETTLQKLRKK
jgi:transglutaminase-like putative cysteine protease